MADDARVFSGKGAQYPAMSRDLSRTDQMVSAMYGQAGETLGFDMVALCFEWLRVGQPLPWSWPDSALGDLPLFKRRASSACGISCLWSTVGPPTMVKSLPSAGAMAAAVGLTR